MLHPGTKPTPSLFTIPNTELTVPAKVSLIMLNATNGGEYVIALEDILDNQLRCFKEKRPGFVQFDSITSLGVLLPKDTNASCNSGLTIS